MDVTVVERVFASQFAKKQKAADLNWSAVQAGYQYATETLTKHDPYVAGADECDGGEDHYRRQRRGRDGLRCLPV